jgi:pyruvate,orthophosphate dikinase
MLDAIMPIEIGMAPPPDVALAQAGNKAFNLMRLAAAGFPVPAGFVLPTGFGRAWRAGGCDPAGLRDALAGALRRLESACDLRFGDPRRPLLVAVRSGAPVSMPGMMDTVLDVGLTPDAIGGLIALTGDPRVAWDCRRRLIEGFAQTVAALPAAPFDAAVTSACARAGVSAPAELDSLAMRELARGHAALYAELAGEAFPDDPLTQLSRAVAAVFASWDSPRAKSYRALKDLDDATGTAVAVQRMVFGNSGARSGSGVGFTRDPATGEKRLYLDFALDGQGEDVVSGRRGLGGPAVLSRALPPVAAQLEALAPRLERLFADAQDFEFTVENGTLYLLQTRAAKRSDWAKLVVAVAFAQEGLIAPGEALARVAGIDLDSLVRRRPADADAPVLARGVAAGGGIAAGPAAFDDAQARDFAARGTPAILVRADIATDDIDGIAACAGILTRHGGRTSHAAVVARELGKAAVVGCGGLSVDAAKGVADIAGAPLTAGMTLTIDGDAGTVHAGALAARDERPAAALAQIAAWRRGIAA